MKEVRLGDWIVPARRLSLDDPVQIHASVESTARLGSIEIIADQRIGPDGLHGDLGTFAVILDQNEREIVVVGSKHFTDIYGPFPTLVAMYEFLSILVQWWAVREENATDG